MLFLQDYDLIWGVEWGINIGPADALSQKDDVDTADNNSMVMLLPPNDTCHYNLQCLDLDLA